MTNVTQIATVASGVIQLIEVGRDIYKATVDAMDAIEAKGSLKGEDKKEWVLAFIKNFVYELGENWEKYFLEKLSPQNERSLIVTRERERPKPRVEYYETVLRSN